MEEKLEHIGLLLALTLLLVCALPADAAPQISTGTDPTVAYVDGHVWDGEHFVKRTLFVQSGRFVKETTAVDTTIDLDGGYVVPPFGDAHTHSLGVGGISVPVAHNVFMQNGVFYAADLTNPYSEIAAVREWRGMESMSIREWFEKPMTIDVAFALGGITATGSWPAPAFEPEDSPDATWTAEGDAFWFMDTVEDVQEKWPEYIAQEPDIVKVYISYVDHDEGRGECGVGLCPEVLRVIVKRAHDAGKRVFAHVNTAADVSLALEAGVDALAHLPLGNDGISIEEAGPYLLSTETIRRIGEKNMVVVPTALLLVENLEEFRTDTLQQEITLQRRQIRRLHEARARIALSGHNWRVTSLREAMYFHVYDFFGNRTLLNLWSQTTPQAIFPDRKLGRLAPGYEASFLVLGCNPIENFDCVRDIRRGIKEGHMLNEPKT